MSLKPLFRNWKVWLLIVCFILAVVAIYPNPWASGVAIRSVVKDSSASLAGFVNPKPTATPMSREVITSINNQPIKNLIDYESFMSKIVANTSISIKTNKDVYVVYVRPEYEIIILNETELRNFTEPYYNETSNTTINVTVERLVNKTRQNVIGVEDIGLNVYDAPKTNIRKGLDLQGGTRVLLKPEEKISSEDLNTLIENMKERLNVYGLSDIVVKPTADLSGENFILVEIAGASDQEVKDLLSKQGKFEGKIGNDTVFKGGVDIKHVCKTADCSRIQQCNQVSQGYTCRFVFAITLSPESAQRQAALTKDLPVTIDNGEGFLSKPLDLYLDDELVDSLRIGESLKGRAETEISISGSGVGLTQQEAMLDATDNMKRLQTILITGSLPVKLSIVKTDNISPTLGKEFISNTLFVGFIAMILVILAIMIRYRKLIVSIPIAITLISELVILLGVASLIGWNIDLIAIAAIIIAIGTGVDSQLVIIDEISGKYRDEPVSLGWKDKIKNAFFIVMASYFTLVVAMIPLMFAGAGLLKGFAITTIIGVSIGVFITRPSFAVNAEHLLKNREE
jgi:preprotein translocase subunit SecD